MLRGLGEIPWTLDSGQIVQLPDEWPGMTQQEQVNWISSSALPETAANALEYEFGLEDFSDNAATQTSSAVGSQIGTARALSAALSQTRDGYILAEKGSPAYIVALENWWSFSVQQDPFNPTQFKISGSNFVYYAGGGIALLVLVSMLGGRYSR